jgi:hypothetical protein
MSTTYTTNLESASIKIAPADSRCRYWAKVIRAGEPLPPPSMVGGANDIPAPYARMGEEELFPGDILIQGEENHHRRARGWTYTVRYCDGVLGGRLATHTISASEDKALGKAMGRLPRELLAGSGDVAAAVRYAHLLRSVWADGLPARSGN